jgi:hypothetical protein
VVSLRDIYVLFGWILNLARSGYLRVIPNLVAVIGVATIQDWTLVE